MFICSGFSPDAVKDDANVKKLSHLSYFFQNTNPFFIVSYLKVRAAKISIGVTMVTMKLKILMTWFIVNVCEFWAYPREAKTVLKVKIFSVSMY